jgi:hypothetical protein
MTFHHRCTLFTLQATGNFEKQQKCLMMRPAPKDSAEIARMIACWFDDILISLPGRRTLKHLQAV